MLVLTTRIEQINLNITRVSNSLPDLNLRINQLLNPNYGQYTAQLETAMVEKQLVDGLVINLLVAANLDGGLTPVQQVVSNATVNLSEVISSPLLELSSKVENNSNSGVGIFRIDGPGIRTTSSPFVVDNEQCNFPSDTVTYGYGRILGINTAVNTFTIQGKGTATVSAKFYACSVLLGPAVNYRPKVGDLICFKSLREVDGTMVILESLVEDSITA